MSDRSSDHPADHLDGTGAGHADDSAADTAADTGDDLTVEMERALAEARSRLLEVPAEVVVTNHVMGLYELAAIHLSADPPDLVSAALAIDSVALLVDGLGDRLGEEAPTMRDALVNIRMAFVQVKAATGQSAGGD